MTLWRTWIALAVMCAGWVLAFDTYVDFQRVRERIAITSLPRGREVVLPVGRAAGAPGRRIVLVLSIRSGADRSLTISAQTPDGSVQREALPPQSVISLNLSWTEDANAPTPERIIVSADDEKWVIESAELSNAYGFSRGAIEFLILPIDQPFTRPGIRSFAVFAAALLLAIVVRPAQWPRPIQLAQRAIVILAGVFLTLVALSPVVTRYRIALAPHTLVLVTALLLSGPLITLLLHGVRRLFRAQAWALTLDRWIIVSAGAGTLVFAVVLWQHMGAFAGGADSSGYLNSAHLLSHLRTHAEQRAIPDVPADHLTAASRVPLGFRQSRADAMAPTYPIGVPLLLWLTSVLVGWTLAAPLMIWLHAVAGLGVTFAAARQCGVQVAFALLAALMVAISPLYLFLSVQLMSDLPATVWTAGAVALALKSRRSSRSALAAGATFSMAVLIRPTDAVAILPLAIALGAERRQWFRFVAGLLPLAIVLAFYNTTAYGNPLRSGYGDLADLFSFDDVAVTIRSYVAWLPALLSPVVALALLVPVVARGALREASVLIVWATAFLATYALYGVTHEAWWTLRFVLPAFPPLAIGAAWVMAVGTYSTPLAGRRVAAAIVLSIITAAVIGNATVWNRRLEPLDAGRAERIYPDTSAWVTMHVPSNAVVIAGQFSGSLYHDTPLPLIRLEAAVEALPKIELDLAAANRPLYAVLHPADLPGAAPVGRLPGRWALEGRVREAAVWRLVSTE